MSTATHLAPQFEIPGSLKLEDTPGGLVRAVISTPLAEAEVYLQGAHVARWTPRGQKPVLFMSSTSLFAPGKAIRGGVPVIFPWFGGRSGGKPGPAHGFARSMPWSLESARLTGGGEVEIAMTLSPSDATRALGFDAFHARFRVTVGSVLRMELEICNDSAEPFTYEEALHTYFSVSGIHQASVSGLEGTTYIDKTDGFARKVQPAEPVRCAKETDQVHLDTSAACVVHDSAWNRRIVVEKQGSASTIVWNPWSEKAAGMADMGPGEWERMICVESGNAADNAVTLPPGASHILAATIRVA
jgi:glucose-6-phosphate 1-epimerase